PKLAQNEVAQIHDPMQRLVVVATLAVLPTVWGKYSRGDVVSMVYRSQQSSWRTPWGEALRSQMPKYMVDGVASFVPAVPSDYSSGEKLALSFALSDMRFIVPWVDVEEGQGKETDYLKRLVITLYSSDGDIARVKSLPQYYHPRDNHVPSTQGLGKRPQPFEIEYRWANVPQEEPQVGINVLFFVTLLLTTVMAFMVCNGFHEEGGGVEGKGNER
ncbi:unnamed protein product, partial [Discosporangium mesarthrocarpum]